MDLREGGGRGGGRETKTERWKEKKKREKREEGKIVENMESRKRKVWREREVRVR